MACGDKYKYLVVTSSGLTPEHPGSETPFFGAKQMYTEWYELARKLSTEAHARFQQLGEVEGAEDPSYPMWNALVDLNNRMTNRFEQLPSPFWSWDRGADAGRAQTVIGDAICLMQEADFGLEKYGVEPPPIPSPLSEPKWPWWYYAIGGTAAVAVLGLTIAVVTRRRTAQPITIVVQDDDGDGKKVQKAA